MLIGAGVSCIIIGWYLKIDSIIILPSFLEKNNIGNILTVFCSVITFLGYSNDFISFYRRDMHISKVEQN
jgi:hypothetical protein